MCSITRRRVSGSSFPSRKAASVSSEGKPVCSICSTVLTSVRSEVSLRPRSPRHPCERDLCSFFPPVPGGGMRATFVHFLLTHQAEGDVLVAVVEEVGDVGALDAGLLQGYLQALQQLLDALVEFLHIEREDPGDVGDAHGVSDAHAQDDLVFSVEA